MELHTNMFVLFFSCVCLSLLRGFLWFSLPSSANNSRIIMRNEDYYNVLLFISNRARVGKEITHFLSYPKSIWGRQEAMRKKRGKARIGSHAESCRSKNWSHCTYGILILYPILVCVRKWLWAGKGSLNGKLDDCYILQTLYISSLYTVSIHWM